MPLLTAFALALAAPPTLADFTPATCEDPARRAALLEKNNEEPVFLTEMKKLSEDRTRKMDGLLERLVTRAKLSEEQKAEVALSLLSAPGLEAEMKQGFAILGEMTDALGKIAGSKDERANCLVVVDMFAKLPAVQASADKQWSIMETALRAEAKKRGVSLEP